MTTETEMELDVGYSAGEPLIPQARPLHFTPRRPLPSFTEMAVQTALALIAVAVIVGTGINAWLEVTPK